MSITIQSIRGMHDRLPQDAPVWAFVESAIQSVLQNYGYQSLRLPLVERTALFERAIGDATDVVDKEMYTFEDRDGERLSLRPEGTAGAVRSVIQHGLVAQPGQTQKLWYMGPMFRYERPQRGRFRCFHQVGAEAFGYAGAEVDAELVVLCARIWRKIGLSNVRLEINSLGTKESRKRYREALVGYFEQHMDQLDDDSQSRLTRNPLRILDSKNPKMRDVIAGAPNLLDYLDDASAAHFAQFKTLLDAAGVAFTVNPRLVRGLDYYSRTVFEWITDELGAQGTICGGGRYDYLVEQQGGKPCPAVGFSMGLERIVDLYQTSHGSPAHDVADVYLVCVGDEVRTAGFSLAERLRDECSDLRIFFDLNGGSFKSQFKRADRSGARIAVILGEQELQSQEAQIKYLREEQDQETVNLDHLGMHLKEIFS